MNFADVLINSETESYDRRDQKPFFDIQKDFGSELDLVDCSKPSVTDSDQGYVAEMPLAEAGHKKDEKGCRLQ